MNQSKKIEVEKEKREFSTRASGQDRVEDKRQLIFKKYFGGDTYICLRTDPCPNDKTNSCKPKKDDDNKCKNVPCMPKKNGDDVCDDAQNKFCCNWDGGDCCGSEGKKTDPIQVLLSLRLFGPDLQTQRC